jgi:NAD(P)H-flavin reductase
LAKILHKSLIRDPDVFYYKISAPVISKKARPGQFVIVRLHENGERIPLSLAEINPSESTISLIVMAVGKTTAEMSSMKEGEDILDLCGPLGQPTHIEKEGRVLLAGGGVGIAPLFPIARAYKEAGNDVTAVIGARSADLLIYKKEMEAVCDRVVVTTDDGSAGIKGNIVTGVAKELTERGADLVMAIGPAVMMKAVSESTRPFGVKTIVSLNTIMVDGTGMCGSCRVPVGQDVKFACTDGPDFDGHQVDWDLLLQRQKMYREEEKESFEAWRKRHARTYNE